MAAPFPEERIRALPKAELHIHLEGTIGVPMIRTLCERHGVDLPFDETTVARWFHHGNFDHFIEKYIWGCDLLKTPEDFAEVAHAYLLEAHTHGAVHVEYHVSAAVHLHRKPLPWPEILAGIAEGCDRAENECGISSLLIPDIVPVFPLEECQRAVDLICENPHPRLTAIGMGGPMNRWREIDFSPLFEQARSAGLHTVSHAGEHGQCWEIRHAVEEFGVERVQHGIRAVRDETVMELLRTTGIPCDVCPGSNVALGAVKSWEVHPIREMIDGGLIVTLSTDDPPHCATDLTNEYRRCWETFGMDLEALTTLARHSLEHCFASEEQRTDWIGALDLWAEDL